MMKVTALFRRFGLLAGALAACSPLDALDAVVPDGRIARELALPYGAGERQRLDLYLPAAAGRPAPVVIFVYGGSWTAGERSQYRFVGQALAARGYLAVLPDYRLHPEGAWPGFVEDTAAAVAWTVRNAAGHGGDPRRIFLMGHSAGAYNAALVATDGRFLAAQGLDRRVLAGLVGLAGPYDFLPLDGETTRRVFGHVADLDATQPARVADAGTPPTLLLHGTADGTVYPRNSERLAQRLGSVGVPVELRLYPGVAHVGILLALSPLRPDDPPVLSDLGRFVAAQSASTARLAER